MAHFYISVYTLLLDIKASSQNTTFNREISKLNILYEVAQGRTTRKGKQERYIELKRL